jgi:hypothetical protein
VEPHFCLGDFTNGMGQFGTNPFPLDSF